MSEINSGVVLERVVRTGACGTWWSASTSGGYPLGLLQLEPSLIAAPAARARAVAAVAAVRALQTNGVLRTTELVVEAGRVWLVVATPPAPTVADLLTAGGTLDAGSAAGIAVDVAYALRDLHAVGLGHGDLAADTVILTPGGAATLVEVGVLAALRDAPNDVGRDTGAWARLARDLAQMAPAPEAEALLAAATTAESGDLTTAVRQLVSAATDLPDFASRDSLVTRLPAAGPATTRILASMSTMDSFENAVRLRFGRGVPESAVAAAQARALPPRPRRRRRSLRAILLAALLMALVLGAGAALWWLDLLH